MLPNEICSAGTVLNLIEMLTRGSNNNPQTTQAIIKYIGGSVQTDSKALALKTMPLQPIEHEIQLVPK